MCVCTGVYGVYGVYVIGMAGNGPIKTALSLQSLVINSASQLS